MPFPTTPVLEDFSPDDLTNPMPGWDTALGGNITAQSGVCVMNGNTTQFWSTTFNADQEAYYTIAVDPSSDNIIANVKARCIETGSISTYDGYEFNITFVSGGTDTWQIRKRTNGSASNLLTGSQEINAGDVIGISCIGSTITGYINGVAVGSVTDTTYTTSGKIGVGLQSGATRIDNFGGGNYSSFKIAPSYMHLQQQGITG